MTIKKVFEVYFKELYLPVSFASNPNRAQRWFKTGEYL